MAAPTAACPHCAGDDTYDMDGVMIHADGMRIHMMWMGWGYDVIWMGSDYDMI